MDFFEEVYGSFYGTQYEWEDDAFIPLVEDNAVRVS